MSALNGALSLPKGACRRELAEGSLPKGACRRELAEGSLSKGACRRELVEGSLSKGLPKQILVFADNTHVNTERTYDVYILRCSDASLYVGITKNALTRLSRHNAGEGCTYTKSKLPVTLVYVEKMQSLSAARKREIQLKKWSRAKKQALIDGNYSKLKRLAKSHQ